MKARKKYKLGPNYYFSLRSVIRDHISELIRKESRDLTFYYDDLTLNQAKEVIIEELAQLYGFKVCKC